MSLICGGVVVVNIWRDFYYFKSKLLSKAPVSCFQRKLEIHIFTWKLEIFSNILSMILAVQVSCAKIWNAKYTALRT